MVCQCCYLAESFVVALNIQILTFCKQKSMIFFASNSFMKTISRYLDSLGSGVGGPPPPLSRSRDDSLNSSDSEYAGGASDVEERRRSRTKVVFLDALASFDFKLS